jgi:hypothetical protein
MTPSLAGVTAAFPAQVEAAQALAPRERLRALHGVLREQVVGAVVRAAAEGDPLPRTELTALAATIKDHLPEGTENSLGPRVGILVRLLREDALEAAWMLARDNASGVVRPERTTSMWAGGSNLSSELPLPTRVDADGRVFAWLPGFRDPRWSVPDEVYDIGHFVVLRATLDHATIDDRGVLRLRGSAFLGQLRTEPDDVVTVRLFGPTGAHHAVAATRLRRPDLVKARGPELRRLAWGGWQVAVPLADLAPVSGAWHVAVEIAQGPVVRREPLGARRGPLAAPHLTTAAYEGRSWRYELDTDEKNKALLVRATPVRGLARRVPPVARTEVRRLRNRLGR